jgi:hypothetical protein
MLVPVKRSTPEGGLEPEDRERIRRLTALLQRAPGPGPDNFRLSVDAQLKLWEYCSAVGKLPAAVEMGSRGGSAKTDKPRGPAALSPKRRRDIARKAALARWGKVKK